MDFYQLELLEYSPLLTVSSRGPERSGVLLEKSETRTESLGQAVSVTVGVGHVVVPSPAAGRGVPPEVVTEVQAGLHAVFRVPGPPRAENGALTGVGRLLPRDPTARVGMVRNRPRGSSRYGRD